MGVLIIHAGLPKTGTSAIQAALHGARDTLAESGMLWPAEVYSDQNPRHFFLHKEPLTQQGDCPTLVATLAQARRRKLGTVVLSSEGMTAQSGPLSRIDGAKIRAATKDWRVKLVFGVRDTDSWERSLYRQCIFEPTAASQRKPA